MSVIAIPKLLHEQTARDWIVLFKSKKIEPAKWENHNWTTPQRSRLISFMLQGFAPFHICSGLFQGKIVLLCGGAELSLLTDVISDTLKFPYQGAESLFRNLPHEVQKRLLQTPISSSSCSIGTEEDMRFLQNYYSTTSPAISSPM